MGERWFGALLAARALLELSPAVRADACRWLRDEAEPVFEPAPDGRVEEVGAMTVVHLDWRGWAAALDQRPLSPSETQLAHLVAALPAGRPIDLVATLGSTGSWSTDIWRILFTWGTGGSNREPPTRVSSTPLRTSCNPAHAHDGS